MEQFSLGKYIANPSRKVVTRDGRSVRIICTDANSDNPVVGLVKYSDGHEAGFQFKKDGMLGENITIFDLFFAPVKKEGWINLFRKVEGVIGGYLQETEEDAIKEVRDKRCHVATIHIEWEE